MLLIGYGIAALIVIIILIAVNVRASRGSSGGKQAEPEETAAEAPGGEPEAPTAAEAAGSGPEAGAEAAEGGGKAPGGERPQTRDERAAVAASAAGPQAATVAREEAPKPQPASADRAGTKDRGFRDALRNLKGGPAEPDREPEPGARPSRQDAIISDSEYRKAMRELRRPGRGEDGR